MMVANAGTVSIAVFLHTLRFKKLINPRLGFLIYAAMFAAPFAGLVGLAPVLVREWPVMALATFGLALNFCGRRVWVPAQAAIGALLLATRGGLLRDWTGGGAAYGGAPAA